MELSQKSWVKTGNKRSSVGTWVKNLCCIVEGKWILNLLLNPLSFFFLNILWSCDGQNRGVSCCYLLTHIRFNNNMFVIKIEALARIFCSLSWRCSQSTSLSSRYWPELHYAMPIFKCLCLITIVTFGGRHVLQIHSVTMHWVPARGQALF